MHKHEKPRNHMLFAMLATALFSIPFGVVAVVYANKVYPLWYAGYYEEAKKAARMARLWAWVAVVISIVIQVVLILMTAYNI